MKDLKNLFKKLVQIDSISGEEEKISAFVFDYLVDLRLNPYKDNKNMIYCKVGKGENPTLFSAHMDTVEPGRSIQVIEKDGYLQSDGKTILGGDNKASLAVILHAVSECINSNINVELLFTVREETDSGVKEIEKDYFKSKKGYIFDGGNGELGWVVTKAPTIFDFEFTIEGKTAHASRPENGLNVLEAFRSLDGLKFGRLDEESTFNIGIINAGHSTNSVPDKMVLKGDLRSMNVKSFDNYKKHIEKEFRKLKKLGFTVNLNWLPYSYGYELDQNSEFFSKTQKFYESQSVKFNPSVTTGGSDAGFLNHIGIETLCLGDGVENIHTTDEQISIKKFDKFSGIVESLVNQTVNK